MQGVISEQIWEKSCYRQLRDELDYAVNNYEEIRDIAEYDYRSQPLFNRIQERIDEENKRDPAKRASIKKYRNNN